jgi:hypothetical protein
LTLQDWRIGGVCRMRAGVLCWCGGAHRGGGTGGVGRGADAGMLETRDAQGGAVGLAANGLFEPAACCGLLGGKTDWVCPHELT